MFSHTTNTAAINKAETDAHISFTLKYILFFDGRIRLIAIPAIQLKTPAIR